MHSFSKFRETCLWNRPDILPQLGDNINVEALNALREARIPALYREHWDFVREEFIRIRPAISEPAELCTSPEGVLQISALGKGSEVFGESLEPVIQKLIPWRKGPFSLLGNFVDAEWKSNLKWERLLPSLPDLTGMNILDIGCNNGYYMFRMLEHNPRLVIGIDPSEIFFFQFELMQLFARSQILQYELMGVDEIEHFGENFDAVFCMGILYHHRDPVGILRKIRSVLRPGGALIIETQSIPGDEPVCLFPRDRYAKARNVFFVPTAKAVSAWLERAGFRDILEVSTEAVTESEQRRTSLAPWESLSDFLDPEDRTKTVEGYPAPWRSMFLAYRSQ